MWRGLVLLGGGGVKEVCARGYGVAKVGRVLSTSRLLGVAQFLNAAWPTEQIESYFVLTAASRNGSVDIVRAVLIECGKATLAKIHDAIAIKQRLSAKVKQQIEFRIREQTANPYW